MKLWLTINYNWYPTVCDRGTSTVPEDLSFWIRNILITLLGKCESSVLLMIRIYLRSVILKEKFYILIEISHARRTMISGIKKSFLQLLIINLQIKMLRSLYKLITSSELVNHCCLWCCGEKESLCKKWRSTMAITNFMDYLSNIVIIFCNLLNIFNKVYVNHCIIWPFQITFHNLLQHYHFLETKQRKVKMQMVSWR